MSKSELSQVLRCDSNHIETNGRFRDFMAQQKFKGDLIQFSLLLKIHAFLRLYGSGKESGFDFDKHQKGAVVYDQVGITSTASPVAGHNIPAKLPKMLQGHPLPQVSQGLCVASQSKSPGGSDLSGTRPDRIL